MPMFEIFVNLCSFGSFFGPSQPVISQRVIQESKSLLENQHLASRVSHHHDVSIIIVILWLVPILCSVICLKTNKREGFYFFIIYQNSIVYRPCFHSLLLRLSATLYMLIMYFTLGLINWQYTHMGTWKE